jgi:type I protein arginine methyltransferase
MSNSRQGYSIFGYGKMITDLRIDPYVRALTAAVKPGDVVLDIGTGTGFFAVLACRLGARKVYAIEPDDAIVIARQVAIDNGCAERIEFIQGISTQLDLPERADVIISDLRGILPLYQQHIHSIVDARHRHLAPGGIMIPHRDMLWATLISDPEFYHHNYH